MIRHTSNPRRRGYTLIEMMTVIAIIALLLAMSVGGLRTSISLARQRQTEATILKVHGLMQQRVEAFNRAIDRLNLTPNKQKLKLNFNQTYGLAANVYVYDNSPILNTLVRKQLFQSRFPQNFAERNICSYSTNSTISSSTTLPPPSPHQPITQSSALMYWIITNSEVFGIPPVDESEFSSNEVRDTDGDGLMEFIDGWGRPLRFYRWPTMLFRPGNSASLPGATSFSALASIDRQYVSALWGGLPAHPPEDVNGNGVLDIGEDLNNNGTLDQYDIDPLVRDPDDPTAQMFQLALQDTSGAIMTGFQNLFNTPSTYNAFLIVSAGPDGNLGLGEPFDYYGTSDPTQVPPATTTWPALQIPLVATPALGVGQGRLAALLPTPTAAFGMGALTTNPISDNLTNRKR